MEPIHLLITGDFCPQLRIEELSARGDYAGIFNDVIDIFAGNDLNVVDLECPLTEADTRIPKTGPHLKAAPHTVEVLRYAGIGLAAMANNHIMDYGARGLRDTLEACRRAGIATVGVGENLTAARQPYRFSAKGRTIAILNLAENEFSNTHGDKPGANPLHLIHNFRDIQRAKADSDAVIVLAHGGHEFYELPSPRMKETFRFFVEAGADAVVCCHAHRFSGYEVYQGKPIFYGLGNFVFDWPAPTRPGWHEGYAVRLLIGDRIGFELIPFRQNDERAGVHKLSEEASQVFEQEIERLNAVIADDAQLAAAFNGYCRGVQPMYDAFIEPNFGNTVASLRKRGFFPKLMSQNKRRLLLNIMRCEAHRDVLLTTLKSD